MSGAKITCGWCSHATTRGECVYCHRDPEVPWFQRGVPAPMLAEGRKPLSEAEIARRYTAAKQNLKHQGKDATIDNLAEELDRSPRTIREWRERFGLS